VTGSFQGKSKYGPTCSSAVPRSKRGIEDREGCPDPRGGYPGRGYVRSFSQLRVSGEEVVCSNSRKLLVGESNENVKGGGAIR